MCGVLNRVSVSVCTELNDLNRVCACSKRSHFLAQTQARNDTRTLYRRLPVCRVRYRENPFRNTNNSRGIRRASFSRRPFSESTKSRRRGLPFGKDIKTFQYQQLIAGYDTLDNGRAENIIGITAFRFGCNIDHGFVTREDLMPRFFCSL